MDSKGKALTGILYIYIMYQVTYMTYTGSRAVQHPRVGQPLLQCQDEPGRPGAHARCAARELAEETGLTLAPEELHEAGVRITPPLFPRRFRTEFFVARAPDGADVESTPSRWPAAAAAVRSRRFLRTLACRSATSSIGADFFSSPIEVLLMSGRSSATGSLAPGRMQSIKTMMPTSPLYQCSIGGV